ncbi:MAG: YezD family protein [Clostridia bacterium]|nr:YezD family protein [Clostridia bacterium]
MSFQKREKPQAVKITLKKFILENLCNIQNGSITIVKQDNTVIQVNVNETITLSTNSLKVNLAEGA